MRLHKTVRMQMMLMGLGAALLLASSAYAQQDMDPTDFPIQPSAPKVERHVAQRTAQNVEPSFAVETASFLPGTLGSGQSTRQESDFERMILADATMVLILMAGIGAIVLYAKAATKRERRLQPILRNSPYGPVSGATTH
jgi:hypothetical protein